MPDLPKLSRPDGGLLEKTFAIVVAIVEKERIVSKGSRSETAVYTLRVEQTLCGSCPMSVRPWQFTAGKYALLGGRPRPKTGVRYILAIGSQLGAPTHYALEDYVLVPEGRELEIVTAHERAILARAGSLGAPR